MVNAVLAKHNKRLYKLKQLQNEGKNTTYLQRKIDTTDLTKPDCSKINIELDSRFVNFEEGNHFDFIKNQISESLFHLSNSDFEKVVIAYEPIWAIGTGKTASSQQAQEIHAEIRNYISTKYGKEIADKTPILYGGSCNPSNAKEIFACADVDGGLIGGAALKSRDFIEIAKSF